MPLSELPNFRVLHKSASTVRISILQFHKIICAWDCTGIKTHILFLFPDPHMIVEQRQQYFVLCNEELSGEVTDDFFIILQILISTFLASVILP